MLSSENPTPKQDSNVDSFLSRLSVKNTDKQAHKATVDSYFNFFDKEDAKILDSAGRRVASDKLTNNYYDLATDFYEYGWGTSFHFAPVYRDSTYAQCLTRHEDFLALKLQLKPSETCLDVGCGVGGPMREIAKFSGARVVGLNNNEYQVGRCQVFGKRFGLDTVTRAVKGNFEQMPFEDNSFDKAYAIGKKLNNDLEATCHAKALENPYGEVFRVLKPGGYFACYEWLTTPNYDPNDKTHQEIIHNLERGNGISQLHSVKECLDALKAVGFEVIEYEDMAEPTLPLVKAAQVPWHTPLKGSYELSWDAISRWKMNPIGRIVTDTFVWILETLRLAPPGTRKISQMLNLGAEGLVAAGDMELFTPMFFFLARKPVEQQ